VAAEWPHRRPVQRALRWEGLFPTGLPGPAALAELVGEVRESRPAGDPFDVIVGIRAAAVDTHYQSDIILIVLGSPAPQLQEASR